MRKLSRRVQVTSLAVVLAGVLALVACNTVSSPTAPSPTTDVASAAAPGGASLGSGTPDGEPPAVEAVCDGLSGKAHGLCVSYCEALDCDSATTTASAQACEHVRGDFVELTGGPLPCEDTEPPGGLCGDGICQVGNGEDCVTCAADCNGEQGGSPARRFCCGFGGDSPVSCSDSRCTSGRFECTDVPVPADGAFQF